MVRKGGTNLVSKLEYKLSLKDLAHYNYYSGDVTQNIEFNTKATS